MPNSILAGFLTTGSYVIATASGIGVGAAGAMILKSRGFRPFLTMFAILSIAATAAQSIFWDAISHGTTTVGNTVFPSGIGVEELVEVLFRQTVVLALAFQFARKDAGQQASIQWMMLRGALSAAAGFALGIALQTVLSLFLAIGCFSSSAACHF